MSFQEQDEICMCITAKEATVALPVTCALASFNKRTKQISVFEYADTGSLPTTESLLLQIEPRRIAIYSHSSQSISKQLTSIVNDTCANVVPEILATPPSVDESLIESDLTRLLIDSTVSWGKKDWLKSDLCKKAFSALLKEFRILSNAKNFNSCHLNVDSSEGIFVKLDRATFNALNLFASSQTQTASTSSLFGLLNKCKTRMGVRRLQQWIRQPLVDLERIRTRHCAVEALVGSARVRQLVHGARLNRVPDLDLIGSKLANVSDEKRGDVYLEDLVKVYEAVVAINCLTDDLKSLQSEALTNLVVSPLEQGVRNMEGFMRLIESTLDLEAASKNDFRVDSKFDPSLAEISKKRDSILKEMEKLRSGIEKSAVDGVKLVDCLAPFLMAFRVSRKQMPNIQSLSGKSNKFKQVQINKAEYLFTSDALMELVEELQSVESEYQKKASSVVKKIVSVASSYHIVVASLSDALGILDVINSFAVVASMCKLSKPVIDPNAPLDLKRCRHLLVEVRSLELLGTDYIPNNVFMSRDENCQIITGPNMGGKSTYIRSVALAVLMNQIGCYVPCDPGSTLPVFDSIMCRVGASDAQVRGISTFMQEMIEAATIVNSATSRSLVIVDELGRGTSTQDGFGLAWAIARHLKDVTKSFVFFATHFHELSNLPGVVNRHVAAAVNERGLTLLYEVRNGPTSNSFGPNVAALAGFPAQVVEDAIAREKQLVFEAGNRMEIDAIRE